MWTVVPGSGVFQHLIQGVKKIPAWRCAYRASQFVAHGKKAPLISPLFPSQCFDFSMPKIRHNFCMEISVQWAAFWLVFHHKSSRRAAVSKTFTRKPQGLFARLQWMCLEHGLWRLNCLTPVNINRVRRLNACSLFWWCTHSIWQVACCHFKVLLDMMLSSSKSRHQNKTEGQLSFIQLKHSAKYNNCGGFASIFIKNLPLVYKLPDVQGI